MDWKYWDALVGGIFDVPIFEEIGAPARQAGVLTREQLIRICHWKSPRRIRLVIDCLNGLGNQDPVEFTRAALTSARAGDDREAIRILTQDQRNGIGVPRASAILTVVYPKLYGIIDTYSMEGLAALGMGYKRMNQPSDTHYVCKFLPRIRCIAEERDWTPRRVEKALYTWGEWQNWEKNVRHQISSVG
jgi:hypothetical protein